MEEIKITVGEGGKVVIDVDGVKGSKCTDLTKKLEKALGKTSKVDKKDEFYQQEQHNERNQSLGGGYGAYNG